jgi:hypothetical protein
MDPAGCSVLVWFFLALLLLSLGFGAVASHLLTMLHHLLLMLAAHLLLMMLLSAHTYLLLLTMLHLLIHRIRPVTGTLVFH